MYGHFLNLKETTFKKKNFYKTLRVILLKLTYVLVSFYNVSPAFSLSIKLPAAPRQDTTVQVRSTPLLKRSPHNKSRENSNYTIGNKCPLTVTQDSKSMVIILIWLRLTEFHNLLIPPTPCVPAWSMKRSPAGMWMESRVIQALGMGNSAVAPPPPAPLLPTW